MAKTKKQPAFGSKAANLKTLKRPPRPLEFDDVCPPDQPKPTPQQCHAAGGHYWDPSTVDTSPTCTNCGHVSDTFQSPLASVPVEEPTVAPQAHAADEPLPEPTPDPRLVEADTDPTPPPPPVRRKRDPAVFRMQSLVGDENIEPLKGKIMGPQHSNVMLTGPTVVYKPRATAGFMPKGVTAAQKPEHDLLCVYLPGVLKDVMDETYPLLTTIRLLTDNRGLASGSVRVKAGTTRTRTKPVMSGVMGSMDPVGPMQYCRLTAYTAKNVEQWANLLPLWQAMAQQFEKHVPFRYHTQLKEARRTPPEWVIPGTPYTTITINNSYSTGLHTDSGDLDAGFSCLAVCRRGDFVGGALTFPQYRISVDMQDGDMILMDAHEWHGNTMMQCACRLTAEEAAEREMQPGDRKPLDSGPCKTCGAERVSVVAYYRTAMTGCGSMDEEQTKKAAYGARRIDAATENEADLAAVSVKA